MAVIKVPKTPRKAFNKNRRPSALLLSQIEHLEWAALPASHRKPDSLPKAKPKTEGQAAERVAQLTGLVLAARAKDATSVAPAASTVAMLPVTLPPLPEPSAAATPRPARRRRRKKARPSGRKRTAVRASSQGRRRKTSRARRPRSRQAKR
jgi:hypothetical protein